jgi:hypothetical protein
VPAAPPGKQWESGLAAAFTPGAAQQPADLGALEALGSGALPSISLASLDGTEEGAFEPTSLTAPEPPPPPVPAPAPKPAGKPATTPPKPALPSSAKDMFAPPDEETEGALQLGDSPAKPPPKPAVGTMAADAPPLPSGVIARKSGGMPRAGVMAEAPRLAEARDGGPLQRWFEDERKRTIVGVLFAVALGFLPATLVGSAMEGAWYGEPIARVEAAQQQPNLNDEHWLEITNHVRPAAIEDMKRRRGRIELVSFVVWMGAAGGLSWLWFRKLT